MSQRQRDDMVLLAQIHAQHRISLQSYGRPRMTEELQELGLRVGHTILFTRVSATAVKAWLQDFDERQGQLLRQFNG